MNSMKLPIRFFAGAAVSAALVVSAPHAFGPAAPAAAQAQSGDLAQAVAALRGISTLKADFVQIDRAGKRLKGVMTLKRPGRVRFQYEKGVPLLIVGDGRALTFIDYEVRQVQRWPIGNTPLGALLDPKRDVMKYGKLPTGQQPERRQRRSARQGPSRIRGHHPGLRAQGFGPRRTGTDQLGRARLAEQADPGEPVESPVWAGGERQHVPLQRSATHHSSMMVNGPSRAVPDLRQFATLQPCDCSWASKPKRPKTVFDEAA
jgi:hypothetical protein